MSEVEKSEVLLNCPFCGGKSYCCYDTTEQRYKVFCNDCGIAIVPQYPDVTFMPNFNTLKETIRTWNTRKPMERIVERLEEYRDDFMNDIYDELQDDTDNLRANRIIDRFDEAIEIVKEVGGDDDKNY